MALFRAWFQNMFVKLTEVNLSRCVDFLGGKLKYFLFNMFLLYSLLLLWLHCLLFILPIKIATFPRVKECLWRFLSRFFPSALFFVIEISYIFSLSCSFLLRNMFVCLIFYFSCFAFKWCFSVIEGNLRLDELVRHERVDFLKRNHFFFKLSIVKLIWCHRCSHLLKVLIRFYCCSVFVCSLRYAFADSKW